MNFLEVAPILGLGAAIIATMSAAAWRRNSDVSLGVTLAGVVGSLALIVYSASDTTVQSAGQSLFLIRDAAATTGWWIALLAAVPLAITGRAWIAKNGLDDFEEYQLLLLLSTFGVLVLASANHFATLFLGIEITSVALYGLVSFRFQRSESLIAGSKYLLLGAVSSAILLFGIALVYADTGSLSLSLSSAPSPTAAIGLLLILAAVSFKLALAPFHLWSPDVYADAPAPGTAILASIAKVGAAIVAWRLFCPLIPTSDPIHWGLLGLSVLSMVVGALYGLTQTRVRRILAGSSMVHLGTLLLALQQAYAPNSTTLLDLQAQAAQTVGLYLAAYVASGVCVYGGLSLLGTKTKEIEEISDLRGVFQRQPALALVIGVGLLSMLGMPFTAGFIGKLSVLTATIGQLPWGILLTVIAAAIVSAAFYLRILVALFQPSEKEADHELDAPGSTLVLVAVALLIVIGGVVPLPIGGPVPVAVVAAP